MNFTSALEIESMETTKNRVDTWNKHLDEAIRELAVNVPHMRLILFSSHKVLSDILNNPVRYGFTLGDTTAAGAIWDDHLHLTSEAHRIIANQLFTALMCEGMSVAPL